MDAFLRVPLNAIVIWSTDSHHRVQNPGQIVLSPQYVRMKNSEKCRNPNLVFVCFDPQPASLSILMGKRVNKEPKGAPKETTDSRLTGRKARQK